MRFASRHIKTDSRTAHICPAIAPSLTVTGPEQPRQGAGLAAVLAALNTGETANTSEKKFKHPFSG